MLCGKKQLCSQTIPSLITKPNKKNTCINFFDFQRRNSIIDLRNVLDLENGMLFAFGGKISEHQRKDSAQKSGKFISECSMEERSL